MTTTSALPKITDHGRRFWEAAGRGTFELQRCDDCLRFQWFPRTLCRYCHSTALTWLEHSGTGTVYSFTIIHRAPTPDFTAPYVLAYVDLEPGVRMMTNIVNCDVESVRIGMPVRVLFRQIEDVALPVFEPMSVGAPSSDPAPN